MGARDDLLDRVIAQVAATGLADQSLRELASGVGTSHRMLIYHFGSRPGLVAAIAARVEADTRDTLLALAADSAGLADLQRRLWARVSAPEIAPFVRLFFDVLGLALAGSPGTETFRDNLVEPWLAEAERAAEAVGITPDRDELRLGIAVTRGLLLDALATGDVEGATRAHDRFVDMWEATRSASEPGAAV